MEKKPLDLTTLDVYLFGGDPRVFGYGPLLVVALLEERTMRIEDWTGVWAFILVLDDQGYYCYTNGETLWVKREQLRRSLL